MNIHYLKYEFLRLLRNRRFFFFSLVFPVLVFVIFGLSNRNQVVDLGSARVRFILFYMVGMAGYGSMMASIAGGARIAAERSVGWNRQLRLTPLSTSTYFAAKILSSYFMALISIVVLFVIGALFGVHVPAARWPEMIGLILLGLLPFVAIGILFGHLLTVEAMGPALGGGAALFALLGGMWFPFADGSTLQRIGEYLPSYWISQAARSGVGESAWTAQGWLVVAAWTVAATLAAARAYQHDTRKV